MGQQKLIIPPKKEITTELNVSCNDKIPDNVIICNHNTLKKIQDYIDKTYDIQEYISYE